MSDRKSPAEPQFTIGMATFDDFDGVYFSITSLLLHHAEALEHAEIVVVDNNPHSRQGKLVRDWISRHVPKGRYSPFPAPLGTAPARNEVFRQALGEIVLCLDCHVLLAPGAVGKLLDYYAAHPDCPDLLTGPLLNDAGEVAATHQEPRWSAGAFGVWRVDDRGRDPLGDPFEIWQQGMGLFSCLKKSWVGFHPEFRGFGGCETYVMEKFRRQGGRVLCCPFLRWTHRFPRANPVPYVVSRADTLRNYLIGFHELNIDIKPALDHYAGIEQKSNGRQNGYVPTVPGIALVGNLQYGSVRMRGEPLARHLAAKIFPPSEVEKMPRHEVIIAIKDGFPGGLVRSRCERLIYDPLDAFCNVPPNADPVDFWRRKYDELHFDEILATSPACRDIMQKALPKTVRIHLVPHHSDPLLNLSWASSNGPVAYAGLPQYIQSGLSQIQKACQSLGREFVAGWNLDVLKGASLALALRRPPFATPLYRHCKPQIKIANAIAAGLRVVSTDCAAAVSLYPGLATVPANFSADQLADALKRAYETPRLETPFHVHDYLSAYDRILSQPRKVVYTAIFGGYDALREPKERLPGVQYLCFTDNPRLKSDVWTIRYSPPEGDPLMQAKRYKVLAHKVLDCDYSLWIDGRIELHHLNGVFDWLKSDCAFRRHPNRSCIYVEAEHCKNIRRGDPQKIDRAISRFKAEGHPQGFGLWYGGIILRRHKPQTEALNTAWWKEITAGTPRDQISLPVVLRRLGVSCQTLPDDLPLVHIGSHLRW